MLEHLRLASLFPWIAEKGREIQFVFSFQLFGVEIIQL
jgi:hypothetical protein